MSFWCNFTIFVFISNLAYLSVYRLVLRATQFASISFFLGVVISISQIACEFGAIYLSKKWLSIVPGPQFKHVFHFVMIIVLLILLFFVVFFFYSCERREITTIELIPMSNIINCRRAHETNELLKVESNGQQHWRYQQTMRVIWCQTNPKVILMMMNTPVYRPPMTPMIFQSNNYIPMMQTHKFNGCYSKTIHQNRRTILFADREKYGKSTNFVADPVSYMYICD